MGFLIRHWVTLLIVLPASLFLGILLGTAGTAVHPPLAFVASPLVCAGELTVESRGYSYRPGQSGVSRSFWCEGGAGPDGKPARTDVTLKTIGASMLVYSLIAFVPLWLLGRLARRRVGGAFRRATGIGGTGSGSAAPDGAVDLHGILSQVSDAVRRGDAKVQVRHAQVDLREEGHSDPAERLARLKALHEQGLITDQEYAAKKAEILREI